MIGQVLDADTLELNQHGRAKMDLQREDALHVSVLGIVIDHLNRLVAVKDVHKMVASGDDGVLVPVLLFIVTGFYKRAVVGDVTDNSLLAAIVHDHELADSGHPPSASLVVEEANLALLITDLRLIAADSPASEVPAAVLDAGVAAEDAELGLEHEVLDFAAPPYKESVGKGGSEKGGSAANHAVLYRPEPRVSFPTREVFAVEDGSEAGFHTRLQVRFVRCVRGHAAEKEGDCRGEEPTALLGMVAHCYVFFSGVVHLV